MAEVKYKDLNITRIFDAPVEKVWKYWSESDLLMKWWGPATFTSPSCEIDFRVGGKNVNCMRDAEGNDYWSTGVYKVIDPMKKIVVTDSFADKDGNVVPATHYGMSADFPLEMLITVTFKEIEGNKTKMTLVHEGLPDTEEGQGASQGWNEQFDKLDALFRA